MRVSSRPLRSLLVASLLQFLLPKSAHADGEVNYKFQSWQEASGRIHVDSQSGEVEQGLPDDIKLKLTGVIDTISGATPTGEITPDDKGDLKTSEIRDRRKAWQIEASHPFDATTVALGYANSRESDYISNGYSLNTQTTFNQKNTTLLLGVAATDDTVKVFFQSPWEKKRGADAIIGITQLLDPDTSLTVNFSYDRGSGYLSDPYKIIEKHINVGDGLSLLQTFGENRPDTRTAGIGFASINHNFRDLNGALQADYRFYHDSFGINSHTLSLQWFQSLYNGRLVVSPLLRYYQQSQADFYRLTLDGTSIQPTIIPNNAGSFYSADYRLSRMRTVTWGIKAVVKIIPNRFSIDASYNRYNMSGRDSLTPSAAYTDANVFTVGARFDW